MEEPISSNSLHIESGRVHGSKKHIPEWNLHKNVGDRAFVNIIKFNKPFTSIPLIFLGLSLQDILKESDLRIDLVAKNISATGFELNICTWQDTGIWGASANWIAVDSGFLYSDAKIQVGKFVMKKTTPGFSLHKGLGDRNFVQTISFPKSFSSVPNVFVALSQLDISNSTDQRLIVSANNIKTNSFSIEVGTWQDTKVWSCGVSWIAFDKSFTSSASSLLIHTGRQPFKKDNEGYTLLSGFGDRSIKRRINFPSKFEETPSVVVCLCQLDVLNQKDHRINVIPENVSPTGTDIKLGTWNDTRIWSGSATYFAFGKPVSSSTSSSTVSSLKHPLPTTTTTTNTNNNSEGPPTKKLKTEEPKEEESKECKICMDATINTVIIPCGHLVCCEDCSKPLMKNKKKSVCPVCKQKIDKIIKTFAT